MADEFDDIFKAERGRIAKARAVLRGEPIQRPDPLTATLTAQSLGGAAQKVSEAIGAWLKPPAPTVRPGRAGPLLFDDDTGQESNNDD